MADLQNTFKKVSDAGDLIPILKLRLPKSALILNMVTMSPSFKAEMSFYTLNDVGDEFDCWIFGRYEREDVEQQLVISAPNSVKMSTNIDSRIKDAFSNVSPQILDWDKAYEFVGIDRSVSSMITQISINKGNTTEVEPCNMFSLLELSESGSVPVSSSSPPPVSQGIDIVSLNSSLGVDFIVKEGPFVNEKTRVYRSKIFERCPSVGAIINGKVASAAVMDGCGHLGLVTAEEHRRKGLSHLCLQYLVKKLQEANLIPCSIVNVRHVSSNALHVKAGFQLTHRCDFIMYNGPSK